MGYKNIQFETEETIGILTIDRPKVLNALNTETIKEIRSVLMAVKENKKLRALIITGSGDKAFAAGADIEEIKRLDLKDGFDFVRMGDQMNSDLETCRLQQ